MTQAELVYDSLALALAFKLMGPSPISLAKLLLFICRRALALLGISRLAGFPLIPLIMEWEG